MLQNYKTDSQCLLSTGWARKKSHSWCASDICRCQHTPLSSLCQYL